MRIAIGTLVSMDSPVQHDVTLVVADGIIQTIESGHSTWDLDLRDYIVYPGLINAHVHLDLSLASPIPHGENFAAWIQAVAKLRPSLSQDNLQNGLHRAELMLIDSGCTCVGDYVGDVRMIELLRHSKLRGAAFLEIIGANDTAWKARLQENYAAMQGHSWPCYATPHAPYSLCDSGLQHFANCDHPMAIHAAESHDEAQLFAELRGPLFELLCAFGFQFSKASGSAIAHLQRHHALPRQGQLIHCNELLGHDIDAIAAAGCTVVHCPLSHEFFEHSPFPLHALEHAGVPVALGSDSLASASTLSMLANMRQMQRSFPQLSAEHILRMATINGARALRFEERCGRLRAGLVADYCAIRRRPTDADPYEALLAREAVDWVMINGTVVKDSNS